MYPGGTRNTALKIGTVPPKSGRLLSLIICATGQSLNVFVVGNGALWQGINNTVISSEERCHVGMARGEGLFRHLDC
jgi:hypothetical protein